MVRVMKYCVTLMLSIAVGILSHAQVDTIKSHALTLDDYPRYEADFPHYEYVNPDAPKGGTLRLFSVGGFDTLNPFTIKGDTAAGLGVWYYESLMVSPEDDNIAEYGLIAESVEVADDLSFTIYHLREEARFHDGTPITSEDVVFSFNLLIEHGRPFYRAYYADVASVEAIGAHSVKFSFSGPPNRELPQIVGQLFVFSKSYWTENDFSKTTVSPPLTSGPYRISSLEPGRFVVFERVEDYWGKDLPVNVGRYNFDQIRYDYVRDETIAVEAFKSGEYDFRSENTSKTWATAYDFPALNDGFVVKAELAHSRPTGMPAFVFNTRKGKFKSKELRKALGYAFDFEWTNKNLFYGQYKRSRSFYDNSELAATGLPSAEELELLEPYRDQLPPEVFEQEFALPVTDGSGNIRSNLRAATAILNGAGWHVVNNQLIDPDTGEPLEIEFLLGTPSFERIVAPFARNLERLGIKCIIRTVEPAQYQNRVREFDFDMISYTFGQSRSPGNEQRDYWGTDNLDRAGSRNYAGVNDPVVDALIEKIVAATNRSQLVTASKALDRVLQWGYYVIPSWHINADRVIWWDKFGRPPIKPAYAVGISSWWVDPDKSTRIEQYRQALE